MKLVLCFIAAFAVTVSLGSTQAEDKREETPRFKGVELYSWKDKRDNWRYVLVSGTNRQKTEKEVKEDKQQMKGTSELKKALALLAENEQVMWSDHRLNGFEFPPKNIQKEIRKAAKEAKIELTISDR